MWWLCCEVQQRKLPNKAHSLHSFSLQEGNLNRMVIFCFNCLIWTSSWHDLKNLNLPPIIFLFPVDNIVTFSLIFVTSARLVIKHIQIMKFRVFIEEKEDIKYQRKKTVPKGRFQQSRDLWTKLQSKNTKKIQQNQRGYTGSNKNLQLFLRHPIFFHRHYSRQI